jgi:hypothetical protein
MAITFNQIGVQSVSAELIESVESTKNMESKMIMSTEGGFGAAKTFDPTYEFTVKGRGTTTVDAGDTSAAGFIPDYIDAGGVTVITSVKVSEKNDDFNEFEISGTVYPEAQPIAQ